MKIDKLYHFIAGIEIAFVVLLFSTNLAAISAVVLIGILKECFDKFIMKSFFDTVDLLFTILGGVVTIGTVNLIKLILMA